MEYHKINGLYKRHREGENKGKFIFGDFSLPEFEYLFHNQWIWTEKLDGTNIRIYLNPNENTYNIKGRTDKAVIPIPLMEWLVNFCKNTNFSEVFKETPEVVLYGEGVGKKIQKVGHNYGEPHFKLFDIKIGNFWLEKEAVEDIASQLGLDYALTIKVCSIPEAIKFVTDGFKSSFGDFEAEGLVGQPLNRLKSANGDRIVTKLKTCDFR